MYLDFPAPALTHLHLPSIAVSSRELLYLNRPCGLLLELGLWQDIHGQMEEAGLV